MGGLGQGCSTDQGDPADPSRVSRSHATASTSRRSQRQCRITRWEGDRKIPVNILPHPDFGPVPKPTRDDAAPVGSRMPKAGRPASNELCGRPRASGRRRLRIPIVPGGIIDEPRLFRVDDREVCADVCIGYAPLCFFVSACASSFLVTGNRLSRNEA